jgi:hypothetical protein
VLFFTLLAFIFNDDYKVIEMIPLVVGISIWAPSYRKDSLLATAFPYLERPKN